MTGWRWTTATAALALVGALAGCTSDDAAAPRPSPSPTSGSPSASESPSTPPAPAPQRRVVPAVMLSSVIRTPDGPIRTGIKHPATFIQTRTGFVVQDTRGTTYAVEGGEVRRIGRSDPQLVRLVDDSSGRFVAFASTVPHRIRVYDSVRHAIVLRGYAEAASPCTGVQCLILDRRAVYAELAPYDQIGRFPYAGPGNGHETGMRWTRAIRSRSGGYLSPSGRYLVRIRHDRLTVRTFHGGKDVTPAIPDGPVRQLVWLGPDSFTVEVETASLISPPDGDVWHLLECSIPDGTCSNALTGVTGTALSIPGTPIRSSPRG